MEVKPIIRTLNNKKGKIIKVLKQEVKIPVERVNIENGHVVKNTEMNTISKRVRSVIYDSFLNPLKLREVFWHKGKVIQEDVYQKSQDGLDLKHIVNGKNKWTNLPGLNFEEIAANFFK